jgi:predicted PurR-regulated permease PerM
MLLPFVVGMMIAYLLNPQVKRLERLGLSRTITTVIITFSFFLIVVLTIIIVLPLLEEQLIDFVRKIPEYVHRFIKRCEPLWKITTTYFSVDIDQLHSISGKYAGTIATWVVNIVSNLLTGSLAFINIISLILITPAVTFYLLRDWDKFTKCFDDLLPRNHLKTIRIQLYEIDSTLAGFIRGQFLVCLVLSIFYAISLTLVGLDLGLIVGLVSGIFSFIPYLGTIIGLIAGVGISLAQSQDWTLVAMVTFVFVGGNLLEGNILSPKLVGEKIGLHPVWIIFALLTGWTLCGFFGILIALPVAAIAGVLIRFTFGQYLQSSLYSNDRDFIS